MTSVVRLLSPWPMKFLQFPVAFHTLPRSPILSVLYAPHSHAHPCSLGLHSRAVSARLPPIHAQFQCVSVVPLVPGLVTYTPLLYIPVFMMDKEYTSPLAFQISESSV